MTKMMPLGKTMKFFNVNDNLKSIFVFNEFSEDIEFTKSPTWDSGIQPGKHLDDQDITQIRYYLSTIHDFEPTKQIVGEACFLSSKYKSYHPVKKFIEQEKWDGTPRIDEWLIQSINCDNNIYTRHVSAKFLIATVSRIYNPGCKFDHMLILEGPQGIGKSTLVETLAGDWYLDTNFDNKDKDLIDSMRGVFIVEISELSGMGKKDVDWLKSFLSKKVDRVRLPYASRSKDFKRKCVFVGTYNPSGNNMYLRDDTGNRRFWPVECVGSINIDYVKQNRAQLWAEALERYKQGEKYFISDPEALKIMTQMHAERELESPTQQQIKEWLVGKLEVSMKEIMEDCLKINMSGRMPRDLTSVSTIVGIIMKKLGWYKGSNKNRDKYYATREQENGAISWEE
jgi:putative DNA primase/helicase